MGDLGAVSSGRRRELVSGQDDDRGTVAGAVRLSCLAADDGRERDRERIVPAFAVRLRCLRASEARRQSGPVLRRVRLGGLGCR
jgi:hypothetical protein